jgi:hypothetical protein
MRIDARQAYPGDAGAGSFHRESPSDLGAQIRTTRFGFSLGKLKIDYTSNDVAFDPDVLAQNARRYEAVRKLGSFASHLRDAAYMNQEAGSRRPASPQPSPSRNTPLHKALAAYEEAAGPVRTHGERHLLTVV